MAEDNLPFLMARNVFERGSTQRNEVPLKNRTNFPRLPNSSANFSGTTDQLRLNRERDIALEDISSVRRYSTAVTASEETKTSLKQFNEAVAKIPDLDKLWPRIWKTITLHLAQHGKGNEQRKDTPVELPKHPG